MTFLLLKGLTRFDQPDYTNSEKRKSVAVCVLYVGTQARSSVTLVPEVLDVTLF